MKVAVIGSGSFGIALTHLLVKNNNDVKIWSYTEEEKNLINNEHKCKYLNNYLINKKVICSNDYNEVINDTDYIVLVSPSNTIRNICRNIKNIITCQEIIIASKGIENDKLMSDIVKEELNKDVSIISGPSHAEQIVKDVLTFVEYSGNKNINKLFETKEFKMIYNEDSIGMQIGGVLKNLVSLSVGIAEGLNYESNTISYIITEGLNEIKEIGLKMGAKESTFYGLSGLGDLITTSFSDDSRNKRAGKLIANGMSLDEIDTIEGLNNLKSVKVIINKYNIDCKLINSLYNIIYNDKDVKSLLSFCE